MKVLTLMIFSICLSLLHPETVSSELIVHDMIAVKGKEAMITVETKGKLLGKGGEIVEILVDKKSLGKGLSGGDGFAYRQFIPRKAALYRITARSGKEEGAGLLLSLRRGERIVLIDLEGSVLEGMFDVSPKKGSKETIKNLSVRFPVVLLHTGPLSSNAMKKWLKEKGFKELPVISWRQGMIFQEIKEMGLNVKAVIGSPAVIESLKEDRPKKFSFQEAEGATEVKDWAEIGQKLK